MATTYLQRTNTSATNTYTFSAWVKLANPTSNDNQWIFMNNGSGLMTRGGSAGASGEQFHFYNDSNTTNYYSGAKRRDVSGWYHIVLSSNSGTGTLYVNGETDKTGIVVPNLGTATNGFVIGKHSGASSQYFDGSMSHVHFIDGTAYTASSFGSTDTTTGEWKIKTPSVTYGSQGFFILKNGNSVTDQSGNGNNFTVGGGTLTKTEDNPSNVFATLNGVKPGIDQTLSNGNTTMASGTATSRTPSQTTLGMSSGKYYAEFKLLTSDNGICGVMNTQDNSDVSRGTEYYTGYSPAGWGYLGGGSVYNDASSVGGTWASLAVGDIVGVAINLDNTQGGLNKLYFSKNGVWQNGADPSNHSSVVGVVGITAPSNTNDGFYYFSVSDGSAGSSAGFNCNFGNGYFGTTAVSSAGSNASNNGIFEYDVPTGFTALSTKGLNL